MQADSKHHTIVLLVYNEVFSSLPLSILEAPLLVVVGGLLSEGGGVTVVCIVES